MNNLKLVDEEARRKISEELDKTFLVEAGAGSGKTKSLVDRMIALLRSGRCSINTLAAVTFTRKAAAELRGRFQTELEKAVLEEKEPEKKNRLSESLQNLEQCYIGTIHSFCAKLLRERPIEVPLDPDFKEIEEIEEAVFREKCWLDYLVKVRLEGEALLQSLDEVGLSPEDLKDSFEAVSLYPEVELMGGSQDAPDFPSFRSRLESFLQEAKKEIPAKRPANGYDDLQKHILRCLIRQKNIGFEDSRILMETFELLDRNIGVIKNRWSSQEVAEAIQKEFNDFREKIVRVALKKWREYRHSKALELIKNAIYYYSEKRRQQSRLNFQDLLLHASSLLRKSPEVRQYFSRKFTHILVDEFQDTDPIQAEVLLYLTGIDWEESNWRKLVPRPGSLFLVGDPKQSIFRFRRADIDTYNIVKEQIKHAGGEILYLTANFRSLPSLANWNNPVFKGIFPDKSDRYQPEYAPLNTVREDQDNTWFGVYKITIPKAKWNREKEIAEYDANAIADWIKWACEGNVHFARTKEEKEKGLSSEAQPSDFLFLFRYKKNMNIYARALEERGIPFEITGSNAFSESEEIREIVNLVHALNDPENQIFTVAVLRGIFFGVSDDDLLQFKREGGKFFFLHEFPESENLSSARVARSLMRLKEWWKWIQEYPVSTAMEIVFENSGIINYLASSEMGSSRAGNLFKLLEILRFKESEGVTSFAGLVEFMEELSSVHEIEEISLTPGRTNAVRLMNLHKAKGLEAPVVFLANPAGIKEHKAEKHIIRIEEITPQGYFLFKKMGMYQGKTISQPVGWEEKAEEEKRYDEAEESRLMYVAATRAKNLMVISTYEGGLSNKAWQALDERLGNVPQLKIPMKAEMREREKIILKSEELTKAREELKENVSIAMRPSYLVESVTSLAKKEVEFPAWRRSGLGLSWGRVVHQLLETLGRGKDVNLELLAENVLVAEGRDIGEKNMLLMLIDSIKKSDFWQRVLKAEKRYFEIPFSIKTDSAVLVQSRAAKTNTEEISSGEKLPVILTGTIDLAFQEEAGWVIADYKTDEIVEELEKYVQFYAPQVELYSRFWEEITGQKVKEAGTYFTRLNKWVQIYP
jgi:ATP-dependent helicase/nuclease subunit A